MCNVAITSLQNFNGTLKANNDPKPLLDWISIHLRTSVSPTWLEVSNTKSSLFDKIFNDGPTLVVFSPDNPHEDANSLFDVVSLNICSKQISYLDNTGLRF